MTRTKKTNLKIVGATGICIFSLASMFTGTLAWFASNRAVSATGMQIRLNNEGTILSLMTIHQCNLSASSDSKLVFFSDPAISVSASGISTSTLTMDNYSDLNRTQPVLLLFTLNSGTKESEVVVSAKSDNENYVSTITVDNISAFPFSTSVAFKSASYSGESFPFDNVQFSSLSQTSSFVAIENHSFSSYSSQIDLFTGSDATKTIKYVAVIMDYYPEAREVLLTNNVGVDVIAADNNNVINFYCDWTLEI